jgi:septin family protein
MSKFKVGDTVCFGDANNFWKDEIKRTGKITKIKGLFIKKYIIEVKHKTESILYQRCKTEIYKPLETIKEPVTENEVPND